MKNSCFLKGKITVYQWEGPGWLAPTATRPEPVEDRDEAIAGEPPQVRIADAREIGRRRSGAAVRGAHSQAFPIERLQLFGIGVLMPQIAEYIAASPHHFQLFAFHRNISFNLLKRSLIRLAGGSA
jgi:hypothetical protein